MGRRVRRLRGGRRRLRRQLRGRRGSLERRSGRSRHSRLSAEPGDAAQGLAGADEGRVAIDPLHEFQTRAGAVSETFVKRPEDLPFIPSLTATRGFSARSAGSPVSARSRRRLRRQQNIAKGGKASFDDGGATARPRDPLPVSKLALVTAPNGGPELGLPECQ